MLLCNNGFARGSFLLRREGGGSDSKEIEQRESLLYLPVRHFAVLPRDRATCDGEVRCAVVDSLGRAWQGKHSEDEGKGLLQVWLLAATMWGRHEGLTASLGWFWAFAAVNHERERSRQAPDNYAGEALVSWQ